MAFDGHHQTASKHPLATQSARSSTSVLAERTPRGPDQRVPVFESGRNRVDQEGQSFYDARRGNEQG